MFTSRIVTISVIAVLLALVSFTALAVVNANSISTSRLGLSEQRLLDAETKNSATHLGLSEQRLLDAEKRKEETKLGFGELRLLSAETGLDRHDRNVLRFIHANWGE